MPQKSIFCLFLFFASIFTGFAQGIPGGGGAQPPNGYTDLNGDWWYKIEYVGQTTVKYWTFEGGVAQSHQTTTNWPIIFETEATNGTPEYHEAFKHEEGEVWIWVKWKHGQSPAPPPDLRVNLTCAINAQTTSLAYDVTLVSGVGLPIYDTGIGRTFTTPGKVLRKIKIQSSGDGLMKFTQKAHITANSPWSSCDTTAPNVAVAVDPRDCSITGINTYWPKVKGGTLMWDTSTFPLPQDQYAWFSAYHVNRSFTHYTDLGKPAPITFPTDATDESEWHVGLPGYYDVLPSPVNQANIRPYFTGAYGGFVIFPANGDPYSWVARDGLLDMGSVRYGTYNSANAGEALGNNGIYLRHITIKETRLNDPFILHIDARDAGKTDTVSFRWQWTSDGLQAESKRTVILHHNAELNGQESDTWDDLRVEAGYNTTHFTCENTGGPVKAGWVTRTAQEAIITDPPPLLTLISILGPVFSGAGPFGAIIMAATGIQTGTLITVFACIEMAGALLDLTPDGTKSWTMHQDTYKLNQCDSLVTPPLLADVDGNGSLDEMVGASDFHDAARLKGHKLALTGGITPIQDYYWRMKHRLRHDLKYEMFDKWSEMGYKGSFMRENRKERELANSFFQMEFQINPDPIVGF